ncbi:signal transduction histidine kinase/CheY-like chemotaxis protein [Leptothrix sp. C29]|uniref:histidine kinase n=2 Tax=Sphaerotilus uruguayifluvii TaxID=2735897 RepID=A0ABX2G233_9BURK|nr:signal transduction histidine kinase/CheY-like chemotaxis protein [Leptothrix sp. C29]
MHARRVRLHQLAALQRNTPFIVLGSLLVAAAQTGVLAGVVPARRLLPWLALLGLHSVLRLALWRHTARRRDWPAQVDALLRRHTALSLTSGLLWAGGALAFLPHGQIEHRLLVIFMLAGMVSSSLHSQTIHLPAFMAFFLPCAVGAVGGSLGLGGPLYQAVAFAVFAYVLLTIRFAHTLNGKLVESLRARFEIAALAERLREQKDAAEQANMAKSRFLAAASHDLRQPVHSLSLLVGTLRQEPLPDTARPIVDHIGEAVRTLGTLFSSLLDISRLDAGVMEARPRAVALRPLLTRLAEEARPLAQAKGLGLRLHGPEVTVRTDPVLLERIVRNLLSNAIRYTERGRVVLGCRRRGLRIEVQVIDTGLGMTEEDQRRCFQEFVQLQPASSERQGIGLGLAIVQRLARLLEHPLHMRSHPGRGTAVGIVLPTTTPTPEPADPAPARPPSPHIATGRRVLVLDDDPSILIALELLLTRWGWQPVLAGTLESLRERATQDHECPALIITDLGLEHGTGGLEAIEALREEFNSDLPALLITGNTAPERLREARAAGHALLHKPVDPDRLKATIERLARVGAP